MSPPLPTSTSWQGMQGGAYPDTSGSMPGVSVCEAGDMGGYSMLAPQPYLLKAEQQMQHDSSLYDMGPQVGAA